MPLKIDQLYYELDARTAGFEQNILRSQQAVGDFAAFVRNKPMLATAALGASIVAIGVAAVKMADEVDVAMRRLQAAFPAATKDVERLRQTVEDLSEITPRSQAELADAAARIAETGVENVNEIQLRLRKAIDIADASGQDLIAVIEGLDNVGDAFGLSAGKAADELTRIFAAAQGKVGLDEVFQTLERGGSVLASLGVEAHDAGEAMVALIDAGVPRRQAGTVLTTILELTSKVRQLRAAGGEQAEVGKIIEQTLSRQNVAAKGLTGALGEFATRVQTSGRDLTEYGIRANTVNAIMRVAAAATGDARDEAEKLADAQAKLERSAATNRESASALAKILRNELSESLIRLGNDLLPAAISLIDGLTNAMRRLKGEGNPLRDLDRLSGALPRAQALGVHALRRGTRFESQDEKDAATFQDALTSTVSRAQRYGKDAFSGLTPEKITAIMENIREFTRRNVDSDVVRGGGLVTVMTALNQALVDAKAVAATDKGKKKGDPTTHVQELTKEVRNAIDALERSVASAIAGETETRIDDARERVAAFALEVAKLEQQAGKDLPSLRAEQARLESLVGATETKERTEAAKKVAQEVSQAMNLQSRTMEQALRDFLADVEKRNAEYAKLGKAPLFSPEQIAAVREVRTALIEAARAAEEADAAITKSKAFSAPTSGKPDLLRAVGAVSAGISSLESQRDATSPDSPAGMEKRKRIQGEINKLQGELNGLRQQNDQLLAAEEARQQAILQAMRDQASAIGQVAGLALQIGQAFGIVGAQMASTIQSVISGAASIEPFLATLKDYKAGGKSSLLSVIGAASPIVGGLVSLIGLFKGGEDPQIKAAREANTEALNRLTDKIGDLASSNLSGSELARVRGGLTSFVNDPANAPLFKRDFKIADTTGLEGLFRQFGTTKAEVEDVAKALGITLVTLGDYKKVLEAINAADLAAYTDTFTGSLQRLSDQLHAYGITDPTEKLRRTIATLTNASTGIPALASALSGIDVTTAEGAAAAIAKVQGLLESLGSGDLTFADLGGASIAEARQAFLDLIDQLRGGAAKGTGGYNVDRSITEATGSHLAGLMATGNYFAERTALATEAILRAFTGQGLPALTPPAVGTLYGPQGSAGASADAPIYVSATVQVVLPPDIGTAAGRAAAIGAAQQIGDATAQAMSEKIASLTRRRRAAMGETLIS